MSEPSMLDRLQTELVAAMKSKDAPTLSTVRMLKTALMEAKTRKAKAARPAAKSAVKKTKMSAAARARVSARMKKFWAAKKTGKKTPASGK